MTEKEFRRLSRRELVDIIFELQSQLAASEQARAQAEEALSRRDARLMEAGSIAQAALGLHDVFAHAQAAADQYVADVTRAHAQADAEARRIIAEAEKTAQALVESAREESRKLLEQARSEQDAFDLWVNF